MKGNILYKLEESTIEYDSSVPCIIARHVGFLLSEEFRQFINIELELMIEKKKVHRTIASLTNLKASDAITEEDTAWAAEDWTPRALKAGITHLAFVVNDDVYNLSTISAETYSDHISHKNAIIVAYFKDEESAKIWLRSVQYQALSNP